MRMNYSCWMEDLKWIQGSIWPKMRFFLLNIWCSKCSQDFKNRGSFEKHMEFRVVEPLAIEPLAIINFICITLLRID